MIEYCKPFFVIPMPLNKDGEGPETNIEKILTTVYEVWDAQNIIVAVYDNEDDANEYAELINSL